MPISWWAEPGPSVNKLEKVFQNGAYQHKCPCVRMNSKNGCCQYLCQLCTPQLPLPLLGALQDQQGGLTQAPFKLLLPLVSEHVRFCVCPLGVQSVCHIPVALLAFKALSSWCRNPAPGSSIWDSDPSRLEENPCNCNYPPICGLPAWEYGS